MFLTNYSYAKKIFDFFLEKAAEDTSTEAVYAQQYAHLKLLRYRTDALKTSLENYNIKVS